MESLEGLGEANDAKDDVSIENLWIKFKRNGDLQLRNQLIVHYSDLVNRVVNKLL